VIGVFEYCEMHQLVKKNDQEIISQILFDFVEVLIRKYYLNRYSNERKKNLDQTILLKAFLTSQS
jgi:hypothetical protein